MKRNLLMRIICLVLIVGVVASFSVTAFAADETQLIVSKGTSFDFSKLAKFLFANKNLIGREIIRAQFRTVAILGASIGLTTAGTLLNHSLRNNPSAINYDSSSKNAKQLLASEEFDEIIALFKQEAGENDSYEMTGKAIAFNSTPDLYLSYNQMSYSVTGTKTDGTWSITATFKDTYDFNAMEWTNTVSLKNIITIINNYAAYAQNVNAIVPYSITVTVETSFAA